MNQWIPAYTCPKSASTQNHLPSDLGPGTKENGLITKSNHSNIRPLKEVIKKGHVINSVLDKNLYERGVWIEEYNDIRETCMKEIISSKT